MSTFLTFSNHSAPCSIFCGYRHSFFDDDVRLINSLPRSEGKQVGIMDSWHIIHEPKSKFSIHPIVPRVPISKTAIGVLCGLVYRLGVQGSCDIAFVSIWVLRIEQSANKMNENTQLRTNNKGFKEELSISSYPLPSSSPSVVERGMTLRNFNTRSKGKKMMVQDQAFTIAIWIRYPIVQGAVVWGGMILGTIVALGVIVGASSNSGSSNSFCFRNNSGVVVGTPRSPAKDCLVLNSSNYELQLHDVTDQSDLMSLLLSAITCLGSTRKAEYLIKEDDTYYVSILNMNLRSIAFSMNISTTLRVYDTSNATSKCSVENGSCQLNIAFPKPQFLILSTPAHGLQLFQFRIKCDRSSKLSLLFRERRFLVGNVGMVMDQIDTQLYLVLAATKERKSFSTGPTIVTSDEDNPSKSEETLLERREFDGGRRNQEDHKDFGRIGVDQARGFIK
ncbi:hypothetical protein Scep_019280 [Stephania cephalantha]|uniref:E3 ubiquitin-protein ligase APD1-4 middle domain-containing protein n=1 Tax=Stephania cephalantha TaxID=152367 RepID=A0AAP0NPP5_9MAGN